MGLDTKKTPKNLKKKREEICNSTNKGYGKGHAEIICRQKPELWQS